MRTLKAVACILMLIPAAAAAQSTGPGFVPYGIKKVPSGRASGDTVCATPPTTFPMRRNISYSLDTSAAAHLGITFVGSGNADLDRKLKVFIREVAKYGTCTSQSGNSTLEMGAVWRATVLVDQTNISGQVNFAVVAASLTLTNLMARVAVESGGFANQSAIDQAGQAAMKETATGLNVATYLKFNEAVEKAADAAGAGAVETAVVIGATDRGDAYYAEALAAAFGLQAIADEKSCAGAISAFKNKSAAAESQIRQTYTEFAGSCAGEPSAVARERAKEVLKGIQVRQK